MYPHVSAFKNLVLESRHWPPLHFFLFVAFKGESVSKEKMELAAGENEGANSKRKQFLLLLLPSPNVGSPK